MTKDWLLLALAFPAVFINLGHGQNGFLTVALFAGALVAARPPAYHRRHPDRPDGLQAAIRPDDPAGAAGDRPLARHPAAAATVIVLLLATLAAFGAEVWPAFLASMTITRVVLLEQGDIGWFKIQSVFAWVRMWGGPVALAYVIQGIVTLTVAAALVWFWRSNARYPLKAAALC